ncbi:MAG TPA: M81 family metallopeptidase [Alphaproteobacteria bacterium]|nr:M81 family metallopeptidase [Alphaproteobacteria bacterium]
MARAIAVARLWLEVNSFSPVPTVLQDFQAKEWLRGPETLKTFDGTPTELGAVAAFAKAHPDWDVQVLRCAAAEPGGPMDDALFDEFLAELTRDLQGRRWDAVYLSLHGALATPSRPNPDRDVIAVARAAVGQTPIGVSFDMHGNFGPDIVALADVAAGYKTLPHLDMFDAAERVLNLLTATVEGRIRPVGALARPGCILHSFNMRTTDGPMKEIEAFAKAQTRGRILDVTPYGGFPYADSPFTGASVMVYADGDRTAAQAAADAVAAEMKRRAPEFAVSRPDARAGLAQALAVGAGPVAVLESSDNTYSGGIADTTGLFAALMEMNPSARSVFAYFHDPDLVARAHEAGAGARLDAQLGGRVAPAFGRPVAVRAEVATLTDGVFVSDGPMQRGITVRMGRSAVLRTGNIDVIITERRQPVNDLAYFTLHGIDARQVRLLCVKAKNHFRAAFAPICAAVIEVDTPGPAGIDLSKLPYRYAPRAELP